MDIKYSNHAEEELLRRKISKEIIGDIIKYPEQRIKFENDIFIYQSIIEFDNKKKYLVRVIVSETKNSITVITVYKTSKLNKYRR